jgi:hypothetical protein
MQSIPISEFRPFHLPFEHDELLAKDGIFYYQVFAILPDIRHIALGKNGRFRFSEVLDGFLDVIEERFTGVDDSRKHDEVSILVGCC